MLFLGKIYCFWERFWENRKVDFMIKKNYKGRYVKKSVSKSKEVCRTYNDLQLAYLEKLEENETVTEIQYNIPLDGGEIGE